MIFKINKITQDNEQGIQSILEGDHYLLPLNGCFVVKDMSDVDEVLKAAEFTVNAVMTDYLYYRDQDSSQE